MSSHISNVRPKPDKVLTLIADYATKSLITSKEAYDTARYCLMDTLGCGFEALEYPACNLLLGPIDPETVSRAAPRCPGPVPARPGAGGLEPGRDDPLAGFQRHLARGRVGSPLRQPWRHPGHRGLAVAQPDAVKDERRPDRDDQGARDPGRDRAGEQLQPRRPRSRGAGEGGLDAVVAHMLGCTYDQVVNAVSQAWVDGQSLAPIAMRPIPARARAGRRATRLRARCASRSSARPARWAIPRCSPPRAGASTTCCSRARRSGSSASSAATDGARLFKISFPAEFHSQTAGMRDVHLSADEIDRQNL